MNRPAAGPLAGVRVIEMEAIGPAPFACMLLADMGADIITLAAPAGARRSLLAGQNSPLLRGRSRLEIDLKEPGAAERVLPVFARADIVVEGFRPGVMERLGLGPERLLAANPRIVITRLTGWGQNGPLSGGPGHDPNYIALTGALYSIGPRDGPPVLPLNLLGDFAGGSLYAVLGMLAALHHATRTGCGQVVDAAILDGAASLMSGVFGRLAAGTWIDGRSANLTDGGSNLAVYETLDRKYIVIGALEPQFYAALARGLGLDVTQLPPREDPANWPFLRQKFADIFRTRTRDEWVRRLEGTDACLSGILSPAEALHHPHNIARQVFVDYEGMRIPAPAPRFSATPSALASPDRGDARSLLAAWGVPAGAIDQLAVQRAMCCNNDIKVEAGDQPPGPGEVT
jgi:alpha-methylacyl-CoA racemase